MINTATEDCIKAQVSVSTAPKYAGTIHEGATAKKHGFRGGVVPGVVAYSRFAARLLEAWGMDWFERGTLTARYRRPLYDGDVLTICASPIRDDGRQLTVDLVARTDDGEVSTIGTGALLHERGALPDPERFPQPAPLPSDPQPLVPGGLTVGTPFFTADYLITEAIQKEALSDLGSPWRPLAEEGIVDPGYIQRTAVRHALRSYRLPTSPIQVSHFGRFFAAARVGDRITTRGHVTRTFERKGHWCYDAEQVVIANGRTIIAEAAHTLVYAQRPS